MSAARIEFVERADGDRIADALFRRRFGVPPPDFPHHVIAFLHDGPDAAPLCYVHFTPMQTVLLGGGAVVDDRAMRRLDRPQRERLREGGGLYRMTLEWAITHFSRDYEAIFGYCGDRLAERVDLAAGFAPTGHEHLLVRWLCDVPEARRRALVETVHAVGPF
jgi:hypothetical protein